MSAYEQYVNHLRTWTSKYHLTFAETEKMPLSVLFDLEVVDSKVEAAFEEQTQKAKSLRGAGRVFIDQIL